MNKRTYGVIEWVMRCSKIIQYLMNDWLYVMRPFIYNVWRKRKVLPYRNVKKIVEYLEMHNDDVITLCWHLNGILQCREEKRDDKLEASREKNRARARERHLHLKQK